MQTCMRGVWPREDFLEEMTLKSGPTGKGDIHREKSLECSQLRGQHI